MRQNYRIIDVRSEIIDPSEIMVENAISPEHAAREALGIDVTRSGAKHALVARVYWQVPPGPVNMVRLYARAAS